jgi:hypothetical protein
LSLGYATAGTPLAAGEALATACTALLLTAVTVDMATTLLLTAVMIATASVAIVIFAASLAVIFDMGPLEESTASASGAR